MKVTLEDIIYAMDFLDDGAGAYYHKDSEEVLSISQREYIGAKTGVDIETYPEWQQEAVKWAYDIVNNNDKYISLPQKNEFDDIAILKDYIEILDEETRESIEKYIQEGKDFKFIKDRNENMLNTEKWYDFKDNFYINLARKWCSSNNIEYI